MSIRWVRLFFLFVLWATLVLVLLFTNMDLVWTVICLVCAIVASVAVGSTIAHWRVEDHNSVIPAAVGFLVTAGGCALALLAAFAR